MKRAVAPEFLHLRPGVFAGEGGNQEDNRHVDDATNQNAAEREEQRSLHGQLFLRIAGITRVASWLPVVSGVS